MRDKTNSVEYEMINHTADLGIVVYGNTLKGLFANAAWVLFDLMTDMSKIKPINEVEISLSGNGLEELMVSWLGELIYLREVKSILFCQFNVREISSHNLAASAIGEHYQPSNHELRYEIKAATYHQLKIEKVAGQWKAQVIFDV